MKVSDLKIGTKILLPCPACGHKRSLKFGGVAWYEKLKTRVCNECRCEELTGMDSLRNTKNHRIAGRSEFISME